MWVAVNEQTDSSTRGSRFFTRLRLTFGYILFYIYQDSSLLSILFEALYLSLVCCCLCVSMAVVIRLQGLSVTAGSEDIRRFFSGLRIPDGGVHIIGGELDEAFIIFASDEDARRAMSRSGKFIKDSRVTLLLSSKTEMQNVLERTTTTSELDQKRQFDDGTRHARRSVDVEVGRRSGSRSGHSPSSQHQISSNPKDFFGVFLNGLPFSVNEGEIQDFFGGLLVEEILLLKNFKGQNNGRGFVRFATEEDLIKALKRDREYIGSRYIEVKLTTIHDWHKAVSQVQMDLNPDDYLEKGRPSVHGQRNPQHRDRSRSPMSQGRIAPSNEEYCVMLENLPFGIEKVGIKQLFHNTKLENDQILFFADSDGRRSRSAFVLFRSIRDYCEALSQEKREFLNQWIYTRPISRENMLRILESPSLAVRPYVDSERHQERAPSHPKDLYDSEKACVFVRNLPIDVRKVEIIDFFHGFNVMENRVWVLHDHRGAGVGQALVLFGSEAEAGDALSQNGRRFLGSEVTMKCISYAQMKQLAAEPAEMQKPLPKDERYSNMGSKSFYPPGDIYPDVRNSKDGDMTNANVSTCIGFDYEHRSVRGRSPQDLGNGFHGRFSSPEQRFDGPTCVQLINLPFQIRPEEIYDFCYGYRIIPGSVSLQYEPSGKPKGSATLVLESRKEALHAVQELSGRPIGPRKIQLFLV
uniref:RNA binding motif protein 12B n=2 Tax=Iconisemion striatum TaxID=60296 RepID=A0A1A7XPU5_9TELE